MSVLSGTFAALQGRGLAAKSKRLRLMTWLYLGDLAIAFQIASFIFRACICLSRTRIWDMWTSSSLTDIIFDISN